MSERQRRITNAHSELFPLRIPGSLYSRSGNTSIEQTPGRESAFSKARGLQRRSQDPQLSGRLRGMDQAMQATNRMVHRVDTKTRRVSQSARESVPRMVRDSCAFREGFQLL